MNFYITLFSTWVQKYVFWWADLKILIRQTDNVKAVWQCGSKDYGTVNISLSCKPRFKLNLSQTLNFLVMVFQNPCFKPKKCSFCIWFSKMSAPSWLTKTNRVQL